MKKSFFIAAALILFVSIASFAQNSEKLATILSKAEKQTENYRQTFKNLLADETKIFEVFDKNGNLKKKTTVKSSFLVYQSGKNDKITQELRNVLEVNGKLIPDSQKRSEKFLAELEKATTLEKELKELQAESSKYDTSWLIYGLTLNQAIALAPNLRPFFDFKLLGTENGNEVYVISYQQTKKSPNIVINDKVEATNDFTVNFNINTPDGLKNTNVFLRGKLWIDAKTFQLRREERELTAQTAEPLLLLSNIFEYQSSDYGILLPKTILINGFNFKKAKSGEKFLSLKETSVNFEYSRYRQTNVDVQILDEELD